MSAHAVDVVIFILLIPAILAVAGWLVPWELWIPDRIFKRIAGPYSLYIAAAAWHFKQPWWTVLLLGLMGIAFSAAEMFDLRKTRMLKQAQESRARMLEQAQSWPVADGFVLHNDRIRDEERLKVVLSYMYKVNEEEFFGGESFSFASEDDAERFEARCRERKIKVHYQHDKPEICAIDRSGMR